MQPVDRNRNPLVVLAIYLVIFPLVEKVESYHTTLCINLPGLRYKDESLKSVGMEKFPQSGNLWKKFEEKIVGGRIDRANLGSPEHTDTLNPTNSQYPKGGIRMYRVKNTKANTYLNGWYRVEFWLHATVRNSDLHDSLKALVLHVQDDESRRQNIGEFSLQFPTEHNKCPTNDATKYTVISCGGAARAEPLVANTIVIVRNNSKLDKPDGIEFPPETRGLQIVPDLVGKRSLNFYLRLPMQDCNQHSLIVLRAKTIIDKSVFTLADITKLPTKDLVKTARTVWRLTSTFGNVPGTNDALPSKHSGKFLDCNERMSINTKQDLPWFTAADDFYNRCFDEDGLFHTPYEMYFNHGCQGSYFQGRCVNNFYAQLNLFSLSNPLRELRQLSKQNVAEENQIPICDHREGRQYTAAGVVVKDGLLYYKPKKFNNKEVKSWLNTHSYIKQFAYECEKVYNGNVSCNVSKTNMYNKTKTTTRSLILVGGRSLVRRRSYSEAEPYGRLLGFDEYHPAFENCSITNSTRLRYTGNNCSEEKDVHQGIAFETEGFHRIIWGMRRGHALLMAFAVLFVLPVNLFVTRYFKESFMGNRILLSRVWYQVHIHGTFLMSILLIAGLGIAIASKSYVGVSLTGAALAHRLVGWFAIVLFLLLAFLGGIRAYEDPLRKVSIFLHWLFGLICYLLLFVEMITAVFIPGNGVTSKDVSMRSYWPIANDNGPVQSGAFLHIFVWLVVEIVMHALMMIFMLAFDNQMGVIKRRMYLPVAIPVIKEHSFENASGHGIRVTILCVYVFLALCSTTMYVIAHIQQISYSGGKGLGPMACTHYVEEDAFRMEDHLHDC